MALAGHAAKVTCSASDGSYNEIDGIMNVDWGQSADIIETTDFKDITAAKSRIHGLHDLQVTISGQYESGDAPQALVRTSFTSGATLYVQFLPDGTNGFKCATIVQDFKLNATVEGAVEFSATLVGNGAISTV